MKFRIAAIVLITATGFLFAQERFDLKVRNFFFSGFRGDTAALETGMKMCEDALAADPKNAQALVWHGSGLFFQAGQDFQKGDQQSGMELWQRGLKEMSDAVAIAPDAVGVRIPRGAVLLTASHYVPSPEMARPLIQTGIEDFQKAYDMQGPDLGKLGTHPRGELMIGLADGYSRLGDQQKAEQWFTRIAKEMPGTPYAQSAAAWLETKSLAPAQAGCLGCHTGK
ncbi:MAG TPA: hypothetical protein VKX49_22370 [Bryobacteraceae bacterium]|nr:hypothetical protein [Bryobacteraceae bacterium]